MSQKAHPALVHDAVGPDLPLGEVVAVIALGVIALLLAGVLPALLGALADEHRISASGIGLTATFEAQVRHEGYALEYLYRTRDHGEAVAAFKEKRSPRFEGR